MKGFVADRADLGRARSRAAICKTPVHLLLSYDEEVGCLGVRGALERAEAAADQAQGLHHRRADRDAASPPRTRARRACAAMCTATSAIPRWRRRASTRSNMPRRSIAYLQAHGPALRRRRAVRSRLRRAATPPSIPASSMAAPRSTSCPRIAASISSSAICRATIPRRCYDDVQRFAETKLQPEMKAVTPDAGFTWEEISAFPGLDTPDERGDRRARQGAGARPTPRSRSPSAPRPA